MKNASWPHFSWATLYKVIIASTTADAAAAASAATVTTTTTIIIIVIIIIIICIPAQYAHTAEKRHTRHTSNPHPDDNFYHQTASFPIRARHVLL